MWNPHQMGIADWSDAHGSLTIDARGGSDGLSIGSEAQTQVTLAPVDQDKLPIAAEQYVRGQGWHVNYPQGDSSYALRLSFETIASTAAHLVLEVCVSIQTDLLDTHPKLDLDVSCHDIDSIVPSDPFGQDDVTGIGSAPISIAKQSDHSTTVLLGPHDHPFTTNLSTDMRLRLRLFGDFLEKGVIRKARPWIVLAKGADYDKEGLTQLWKQLCDSPLPLTP